MFVVFVTAHYVAPSSATFVILVLMAEAYLATSPHSTTYFLSYSILQQAIDVYI